MACDFLLIHKPASGSQGPWMLSPRYLGQAGGGGSRADMGFSAAQRGWGGPAWERCGTKARGLWGQVPLIQMSHPNGSPSPPSLTEHFLPGTGGTLTHVVSCTPHSSPESWTTLCGLTEGDTEAQTGEVTRGPS